MSTYYEVKEHLVVENVDMGVLTPKMEIVNCIRSQVAGLGMLMLMDRAIVYQLSLRVNGNEYRFSGKCPDESLRELILAMEDVVSLELVAEFDYTWTGTGIAPQPDLFDPVDRLSEISEEETDGIFFSFWSRADSEIGEGMLAAYGQRGGRYYHGSVDFEEVAEFPEGDWYAIDDITVDGEDLTPQEVEEARRICTEHAAAFSPDIPYNMDVQDDGISYYSNCVSLHTAEEFARYVGMYAALVHLCGAGSLGEYRDTSGNDVRLMRVTYDDQLKPHIFLAQLP